jgi:hypothetical protein
MQSLSEDLLAEIAQSHGITYERIPQRSGDPKSIKTKMRRQFPITQEELYRRISDLKDHTRLFSHLTAINVVSSEQVAKVIGPNQYIIVEGLAEGGSKLGVKLMTLDPPDSINCELYTDLFETAFRTVRADKKKGTIMWSFDSASPNTSVMTIESTFEVADVTAYVRGAVDHVWLDFFENVMVDVGELMKEEKKCAPFPNKIPISAK